MEGDQILGKFVLVSPEQLALPGVEGEQMIVRRSNEHHPVVDDRRGFVAAPDSGGECPDRNQVLHVGDVDLIERAVSPPAVIPAIGQPIIGLGAQESVVSDRSVRLSGHTSRYQDKRRYQRR